MKRLNEALAGNSYSAVGFSYEDPANSTEAVDGDDDQGRNCYKVVSGSFWKRFHLASYQVTSLCLMFLAFY